MPNSKPTPVEVIQADTDAMAAFAWDFINENRLKGEWITGLVQAFAAHRISHAAPVPREPTAEMIAAVATIPGGAVIWRAMYDAALAVSEDQIEFITDYLDTAPRPQVGDRIDGVPAPPSDAAGGGGPVYSAAPRLAGDQLVERLRKHAPLVQASVFIDAGRAMLQAADRIESDAGELVRLNERELKLLRDIERLVVERADRDATIRGLIEAAGTVSFFASAIKSGEPWTAECQAALDKINAALAAAKQGEGR